VCNRRPAGEEVDNDVDFDEEVEEDDDDGDDGDDGDKS